MTDIVAVHGLKGSARKTWTDGNTGNCWLEDFLPDAVPKARIMSFGYDSTLTFSKSKAGIDDFARQLLNKLRMLRSNSSAQNRPIVFVAHSLGGIVVKKALILAHEAQVYYGSILQSTTGIIFMGTPHRGSGLVTWANLLSNLVNIATLGQGIRKSMLKSLDANSAILADISQQFVQRSASLKLMSFTELNVETPLTTLVVPYDSAILGLPNELIFPLDAHHRSLSCFPDRKSQNYLLVEEAIKEIVFGEMHPDKKKTVDMRTTTAKALESISAPVPSSYEAGASFENFAKRSDVYGDFSSRGITSTSSPLTAVDSTTSGELSTSTGRTTPSSQSTFSRTPSSKTSIPRTPNSAASLVTIRAFGLRRKLTPESYGHRTATLIIRVPGDTNLFNLRAHLLAKIPDLILPKIFAFNAFGHEVQWTWQDVFTTSVEITGGKSSYSLSKGLKINKTQSIAAFFSRVFPRPVEAELENQGSDNSAFSKVSSGSVVVGKGTVRDLKISFMRTVRVPEDMTNHNLPPGLGRFPLFNVAPFSNRLPPDMVAKGGLFLPIYQMEALWIYFTCKDSHYAIRPFVGGINGITGETKTTGGMSSYLRRMNESLPQQDYLVLPKQRWLDGISTSPGVVKQFVAAEMAPDREDLKQEGTYNNSNSKAQEETKHMKPLGASIEWQVTGRDEVGGIQLQIIPLFDETAMSATSMKNVCRQARGRDTLTSILASAPAKVKLYNVLNSPEEEGLQIGDTIHLKDMNARSEVRKKQVMDLYGESDRSIGANDVIDIEIKSSDAMSWHFDISMYGAPEKTVSVSVFEDDDFGDILTEIRYKLDVTDGSLWIPFSAMNGPSTIVPLFNPSWSVFHRVRRALDDSLGTEPQSQVQRGISKYKFTWVLPDDQPRRICRISATEEAAGRLDLPQNKPIFLGLSHNATMSDLHAELESTADISLANYQLMKSTSYARTSPKENVFGETDQVDSSIAKLIIHCDFERTSKTKMEIFVRTANGSIKSVECKPTDTAEDLQNKLLLQHRIPMHQNLLSFAGTILSNQDVLGALGVSYSSTIEFIRKSQLSIVSGSPNVVYVKTFTGKICKFPFQATLAVLILKGWIRQAEGIPADQQRLVFAGKLLEDDRTLSDYAIKAEAVIDLVLRLRGGGLTLPVRHEGVVYHIELNDSNTIRHLRLAIFSQFGIPAERQILRVGNEFITDDRICIDFSDKVMDLVVKPEDRVIELAIGAGGSIVQHIEPDTNDPRLWDVYSSKILNVQFLDSRTFREVTKLDPPKTPVTAAMYQKLGLPFLKIWRDKAEAPGVAGQWGNIKGVAEVAHANLGIGSSSSSAPADSHDPAKWGLLQSGAWGDLNAEAGSEKTGGIPAWQKEDYKEPSSVFHVHMLDVDDTMPKFKGGAASRDDNSDDDES